MYAPKKKGPGCGALFEDGEGACPYSGVRCDGSSHAPPGPLPRSWKIKTNTFGVCPAVVGAVWLVLAWRVSDVEFSFAALAASGAEGYWVPLLISSMLVAVWVFFILEICIRRRIRHKYPNGFRCHDKIYIPLSRKNMPAANQAVPQIDQADERLIDELSLHFDSGDQHIVYYETGLPDMGYGGTGSYG
jgi:hypothetical protein